MMTSIKIPVMIQDDMKAALCQLKPYIDDIEKNTDIVVDTIVNTDADLIIFPEMFLTDYSFDGPYDVDLIGICLERILRATRMTKKSRYRRRAAHVKWETLQLRIHHFRTDRQI